MFLKPRHFILKTALDYYKQALDICPLDAVTELATIHSGIAHVYFDLDQINPALDHVNESIHYSEIGNNLYDAGLGRTNTARVLTQVGRYEDTLLYARAALHNLRVF